MLLLPSFWLNMRAPIYLDNNATTGIDPLVLEAMLPELSLTPANPSSIHSFGREAKAKLNRARESVARFLNVQPAEIFFTSGGTESMNWLIRGILKNRLDGHILSSSIEHACVYNTVQKLPIEVEFLPVGLQGAVSPEQIQAALRPSTALIVLSAVNSETGMKNPIEAIAEIAQEANIPFLVDGVALIGKELFSIPRGVSAMGFSGHKFHGPKGVGFAFVRSSQKLDPLLLGGEQEGGLRSGTENLAGIVGLAKAIELLSSHLPEATERMAMLRDRLEADLAAQCGPVVVNGLGPRVCNTSNLSFPGISGEDLLIALDRAGIAVSHGSACSAGALEPSRVLTQMGVPHEVTRSSLRFSLSRYTTQEEIERAVQEISKIVSFLGCKT